MEVKKSGLGARRLAFVFDGWFGSGMTGSERRGQDVGLYRAREIAGSS